MSSATFSTGVLNLGFAAYFVPPEKVDHSGQEDPADFGVFGTENWGPGEVRGNAMRDLASLVGEIEMLPWDEWGPMEDSYEARPATTSTY